MDQSSSTPEIIKAVEGSGSGTFRLFTLLIREIMFRKLLPCYSNFDTWDTMEGSTASASQEAEGRENSSPLRRGIPLRKSSLWNGCDTIQRMIIRTQRVKIWASFMLGLKA